MKRFESTKASPRIAIEALCLRRILGGKIGMEWTKTKTILGAVALLIVGLLLITTSCSIGEIDLRETITELTTKDPEWGFDQTISCPDGGSGSDFGTSVSINSSFVVVGAPGENGDRGAVYIFPIGSDGVSLKWKKLVVSGASSGDEFGTSVSITSESGTNRVAVGAPGESSDAGAVYLFGWTGSEWTPLVGTTGKINTTGITVSSGDSFGHSVSISGGYLLIGAFGFNSGRGIAYMFDEFTTPEAWRWRTSLSVGGLDILDFYGFSASISGSYALIGAHRDETGAFDESGKVYLFKKDAAGHNWSAMVPNFIEAGDPAVNGHFGYSINISGYIGVVGASGSGNNAAYLFKRDASSWRQIQKISQPDGEATDDFGNSVSLTEDFLVAGAFQHNYKATEDGASYLFEESGGSYASLLKLTVNSPTTNDHFGASVAVSDSYLVIGVPGDDESGTDSGSVYIYGYR
jgi:hypothetical protein